MRIRPNKRSADQSATGTVPGFTLIELLVATAIFSLLLILFINLTTAASAIYQGGRANADNNATGRVVMGAISRDISDMVRISDVGAFPEVSGRRALAGYLIRAGVGSTNGLRNLSLVEYSFDQAKAKLIRSDLAIQWDELGKIALGQTNGIPQLANVTPREVCSGVVAFDYDFLLEDGSFQRSFTNKSDVKAVRYGIAIISERGETILKSQGKLDGLIQGLEWNGSPTNESPKTHWDNKLNDSSFASGFPGDSLRDLEIFEHCVVVSPEE